MEWIKFVLDRFFVFVAALIPGGSILLLFILHKQQTLVNFWNTGVIGYQMKITIIVICAFSAGLAIQSFLTRIGAAIGGGMRGYIDSDPNPRKLDGAQPWRESIWRSLLTGYLGDLAPKNTLYVTSEALEKRIELIAGGALTENDRLSQTGDAIIEKLQSEIIDNEWRSWWDHLLGLSMFGVHDPTARVFLSLRGAFHSTSLIMLIALPWTPGLRHWWLIVFSLYWTIDLVLEFIFLPRTIRDPWKLWTGQIEFLRAQTLQRQIDDEV